MSAKTQKNVTAAPIVTATATATTEVTQREKELMELCKGLNTQLSKLEEKMLAMMPSKVGFAGLHEVDLSKLMNGIQTMASEAKEIISAAKDLDIGKIAVGGVEAVTLIQGSTAAAMKKAGLLGEGKQATDKVARFRKVEAFLKLGIELGAVKLNVK